MKNKTIMMFTVVLLFFAILVSGCGSSAIQSDNSSKSSNTTKTTDSSITDTTTTQSDSKTTATTSSDANKVVTLDYITWRGDDKAANDALVKKFEAKYPNIKVNIEYIENWRPVVKTRALAGELDLYATNPGGYLSEMVKAGYALDLTGQKFLDNYEKDGLVANEFDGKVYGTTQANSTMDIFYNKDIFQKYNLSPPTTWEAFLQVCETLKKNGVEPLAAGNADWFIPSDLGFALVDSLQPDNGPDTMKQLFDAKITLADKPYYTVLKLLKEIYDKGYYAKGSSGTDKFGAAKLFSQGKAAMDTEGTWRSFDFEKNKDLHWGMFTIRAPGGVNSYVVHPNQSLVINAKSKHIKEALTFFSFISQPENLELYANMTKQIPVGKGNKSTAQSVQMALDLMKNKQPILDPNVNNPNEELHRLVDEAFQHVSLGEDVDKVVKDYDQKISLIQK